VETVSFSVVNISLSLTFESTGINKMQACLAYKYKITVNVTGISETYL